MPDASKADCNSPGYKSKLACCDGQYGGQVSGACKVDFANPSTTTTKWYTNYGMSWGIAGCKAAFQYPSYVSTFYDNQPDCCKGAYRGQRSGACLPFSFQFEAEPGSRGSRCQPAAGQPAHPSRGPLL